MKTIKETMKAPFRFPIAEIFMTSQDGDLYRVEVKTTSTSQAFEVLISTHATKDGDPIYIDFGECPERIGIDKAEKRLFAKAEEISKFLQNFSRGRKKPTIVYHRTNKKAVI